MTRFKSLESLYFNFCEQKISHFFVYKINSSPTDPHETKNEAKYFEYLNLE